MAYTDHTPTSIRASMLPRRLAGIDNSLYAPGNNAVDPLDDPWSAESINAQYEGSTLMDTTGNKSGRPTYAYLGGFSSLGSPRFGGGSFGPSNEVESAKRDALLAILRGVSGTDGDNSDNKGSVSSAKGRSFADLFADANKAVSGDPLISQRSTSLSEGGRAAGEAAGLRAMNSMGKGTGTAAGETLLGFAQAQGAAQGQQDAIAFENQNRNAYLGTLASLSEAQANRDQQAALAQASLAQSKNQNLLDMLLRLGYL